MRDIKFRVWHKGAREYPSHTKPSDCLRWLEEGQPVVLEQYTGIKDKNGVEIYEGDVVRHWYEELHTEGEVVGSVEWDESACVFVIDYGSCSTCICSLDIGFAGPEVIGNIHENPELLEVNNEPE